MGRVHRVVHGRGARSSPWTGAQCFQLSLVASVGDGRHDHWFINDKCMYYIQELLYHSKIWHKGSP